MPKRMLDSSFLDSPSMEALSPAAQDAFPRFILLADDFGCFEVNTDRLRVNGWSKRREVTEEMVAGWLFEYGTRRAPGCPPVAIFWGVLGRRYCYLTGWNGGKGQRARTEYDAATKEGRKGSKRRTPAPPPEMLASVLRGDLMSNGFPPGMEDFPPGFAAGTQTEIINDSTPARENTVPAASPPVSRGLPAPVVPDVDVDVIAGAGTAAPSPHGGLPFKRERRSTDYPLSAALISTLAAQGIEVGHPDKKGDSAAVEANLARDGVDVIARRVAEAYRSNPRSTLGWYLDDMAAPKTKARPADPRAPVAPSSDWSDKRAPWEIPS